jgi:hypothetical protein
MLVSGSPRRIQHSALILVSTARGAIGEGT